MVISGPIETREMTDRLLLVHGFIWFELATRRGGPTTGRTGTVSFMSCCSIRPLGGSRRVGRCSKFSLLEACAIGPCRTRGVAAIGRSRRWKFTHRCVSRTGKVIHNWRLKAWARGPASRQLMNNFGKGTSAIPPSGQTWASLWANGTKMRMFWDDVPNVLNWRAMRRRRPFCLLSEIIWDGTAYLSPFVS